MRIYSKALILALSVLVFSLIAMNISGTRLLLANPNITNVSSHVIKQSDQSLIAGNRQTYPNMTRLVESTTKNFYDFVAVGDWGCTNYTDKTVRNIVVKKPQLILALGDYSYDASPACWIKKVSPIDRIMKIAIGNHDHPAEEYLKYFGLSNQYYSFNLGNIHFIIMSTEPDVPFQKGSDQFKFVRDDLEKSSQNPNIKWIIVANHRTTYPAGLKSSVAGYLEDNKIGIEFRDIYHPLFEEYRVDLVLQGHVHNYQRTYPLEYNTSRPDTPTITDSHKNYYVHPKGQLFLTIGTGGAPLVKSFPSPKEVNYNAYEDSVYGFLYIKAPKTGSLLEGMFYNETGAGEPVAADTFSIRKGS